MSIRRGWLLVSNATKIASEITDLTMNVGKKQVTDNLVGSWASAVWG